MTTNSVYSVNVAAASRCTRSMSILLIENSIRFLSLPRFSACQFLLYTNLLSSDQKSSIGRNSGTLAGLCSFGTNSIFFALR